MKRRVIASLLTLVLCLTLLPAPAFAADTGEDTPEPAATDIYVSSTGNDDTGDGSEANPYATLAKAVDVAGSGATIYVMSNLTMMECARYYDKDLTITSLDPNDPVTISRGDDFETQSDTARSWYNPAMIEVQADTEGGEYGLTLKNIILDDGGKCKGTVFAQAISGEGKVDNSIYVQDAIVASNATVPCTITLGEGAILRNFGGMSAVRVTNRAQLVMKSGSVIEDEPAVITTRGSDADNKDAAKGPAGAVWLQGGSFTMEAGSKIQNVNGRAVYADGGEVTVGGTISGITGNPAMWQGRDGTAIHLRGMNASATLTSTAVIKEISGGGSAIYVTGEGNRITTDPKSIITDVTNTQGIHCASNSSAQLSGEITKVKNSVALSLNDEAAALLEKEGSIHNNACTTAVVYLRAGAQLTIYGKINDNTSTGNCAALYIVTNGNSSHAILETGGEICNNSNGGSKYGAAVEVQQGDCSFTMNGGKVVGNSGPLGAIQVHKGSAKFIMNGGELTGNISTTDGETGVYIENGTPTAELNAGKAQSITLVKNVSSQMDMGHVYISDRFDLESGLVTMTQNAKTVTPAADSLDIKLGNASPASVTALSDKSIANGWSAPLATFWAQRNGGAKLTVGGLNPDKNLPVYVLTQKTGANGNPDSTAVNTYAAAVDAGGNVSFTLPAADLNGNGCAVAIVQPTQDFGTLTISGPETIKQNKTGEKHSVPHTVTYVTSESLSSIIEQASGKPEYSLVIAADDCLEGDRSFGYHSIDATYMLPNDAFAVVDSLFASAELTVTVGENRYVIPSNVTKTKLLGLESFHVVFDWNDGSGKTETVSVTEGEALGDAMIAAPSRRGYTFTGWNTQQDGKGSSFDNSTVITGPLTVYAQWSENSSGGGGDGSKTYYYFAIEKVDAQDGSVLSSAKFGLFLDGEQIATAASNRSGIAMFRVNESDYRKINAKSDLYYQELTAPEGYILNSDKIGIEKSDLTTSQTSAEKKAETVRNYQKNTPADLNGDDHVAYVHGYTDGTVKPSSNVTRAETAAMLYRLLTESRRNEIQTASNSFSDVSADDWYNESVSTMENGKYITGYPDGTFGGNKNITRAEFVAMLVRFIGVQNEDCSFTDVSRDYWAYGCIATATKAGWIAGYTDGTFKPEQPITRAEAMTIINRVLNRGVNEKSELMNFRVWPDNEPSAWYYYEVIEASNEHEYTGSRPSENWTSLRIH